MVRQSDSDTLERVLARIKKDLSESMDTVLDFRDEELARLSDVKSELEQTKKDLDLVISKADDIFKNYKKARLHLSEVSRSGSEAQQVEAYERAAELMKEKGAIEERERNLRLRRDSLEMELKRANSRLARSDDMGNRLRIALKVITDKLGQAMVNAGGDSMSGLEQGYAIAERESRALARELHDGPAQRFSGAIMLLDLGRKLLDLNRLAQCREELDKAKDQMLKTMEEIRSFLFFLYPREVEEGLDVAVDKLVTQFSTRYGVQITSRYDGKLTGIPDSIRPVVFKVVHQALANALTKGNPSRMSVLMSTGADTLIVKVVDDGSGFDLEEVRSRARAKGSYGLVSMEERAQMAGGSLDIVSAIGKGTIVTLKIPLKDDLS